MRESGVMVMVYSGFAVLKLFPVKLSISSLALFITSRRSGSLDSILAYLERIVIASHQEV